MLIAGDYAPGRFETELNLDGDLIILNLEGPIFRGELTSQLIKFHQGQKSGPLLFSRDFPKFKGDIYYCLANNHFADLGREVCVDNLKEIAVAGDQFIGYGENSSQARTPKVFRYQDKWVGILSVSENQFGGATERNPGVATLGPWIHKAISDLASQVDYLIVMAHAGAEDVPVPLPYFVELYRQFVLDGANLIVGTHPHLPQSYEEYLGSHIFYGLGNFMVDPSNWGESPLATTSIMINLNFTNGKPCVEHFPVKAQTIENKITLNLNPEVEIFPEYMDLCCEIISSPDKLSAYWNSVGPQLFKKYLARYLSSFQKKPTLKQRLGNVARGLILKSNQAEIQNLQRGKKMLSMHAIKCETHREVAIISLSLPEKGTKNMDPMVKSLIRMSPYQIG
jgi:poly-gamma-glutamate synthesis protein (capsule biosynthesis protein)